MNFIRLHGELILTPLNTQGVTIQYLLTLIKLMVNISSPRPTFPSTSAGHSQLIKHQTSFKQNIFRLTFCHHSWSLTLNRLNGIFTKDALNGAGEYTKRVCLSFRRDSAVLHAWNVFRGSSPHSTRGKLNTSIASMHF